MSLYYMNISLVEWGSNLFPETLAIISLLKYYLELYIVYIYTYYLLYTLIILYVTIFELRFKFLKIQTFYTLLYINMFILSLNIINI